MEENILYRKQKIYNKRMIVAVTILSIVIIGLLSYIFIQDSKYTGLLKNQYNKTFYELVSYVENVETDLAKTLVTNSSEYSAQNLVNVWREANLAQSAITQMPINVNVLEDANKLLNQISDYSYTLTRACIYNQDLTEEQQNNLKTLYTHASTLKKELSDLSSELNANVFDWKKISKNGKQIEENGQVIAVSFLENVNNDLQNYSGLIYDGAFSDHITQIEPKGLIGEEITEEQAKEKIYQFIEKSTIKEITPTGLDEGNLKAYNFNVLLNSGENDNYMYIAITQKGGHLLYLAYNRELKDPTLSIDDAKQKGKDYLNKMGYSNMEVTYHTNDYNSVIVNYAYKEGNILIYTDLIKVKIALDNGEILGAELQGYLYNHHERNQNPIISIEEARKKINPIVSIESQQLCCIPTDWKSEVLCYEFKGKVEDKKFLIYINAENGNEQNIYILVEDENGMLTI